MDPIHTWWSAMPGERYWLGITRRDAAGEWLVAPRSSGRHARTTGQFLITYVRDGDAVFHFDAVQQAIVAWSVARGRAQKQLAGGFPPAMTEWGEATAPVARPSWMLKLEDTVPLVPAVTMGEIARVQWALFPALRAFEDRVGEPLSYPFTIGNPISTRLLPGYVFKLPEIFVRALPNLAAASRRTGFGPESLPANGAAPISFDPAHGSAAAAK